MEPNNQKPLDKNIRHKNIKIYIKPEHITHENDEKFKQRTQLEEWRYYRKKVNPCGEKS